MRQMTAPAPNRGDAAPSRAAYRFQRLWLTPSFRAVLRTGVPAFAVVLLVTWYISEPSRLHDLMARYAQFRASVEERPEFMVNVLTVQGASEELASDIRETLPIVLPVSQFAVDLEELKASIEQLGPVASAEVRLRPGGLLSVVITEREPSVLWQHDGVVEALDIDGNRVSSVAYPSAYPDMPLLAGKGAEKKVAEAVALFEAATAVRQSLIGFVRVGDRRWDISLVDGRVIKLPEKEPLQAFDRVMALHLAQDVLARDFKVLDYRNTARPTLRMSDAAHVTWLDLQNIETLSKNEEE